MESTQTALREPSKLIDGRMAVCNLAYEGLNGVSTIPDLAQRKLYIGSLSPDITTEMLLCFFGRHGEIEEGSVTYDNGFGFVTYKTVEAAKKAIVDPQKIFGGRTIIVKLADTHKGKPAQTQLAAVVPLTLPHLCLPKTSCSSCTISNTSSNFLSTGSFKGPCWTSTDKSYGNGPVSIL